MNIVEATGLKKYYRRGVETVRALDGVNLCLMSGELVAMVGPSGSGKTTLMNLISCLDTPTAGQLKVADCDVTQAVEHELVSVRRDFIGFIFQQFHLIPTLTATENAELPTLFSRKKFQRKDTIRLLEQVGLKGCEHLFPYHLSAGDKQRIAIARALVNDPKLLIADEPTGKLETAVRDSLLSLFRNLANGGLSVLFATHDLELAVACDRILYLQDGVLVSAEESSLFMETVSARYY